MTEVHPRQSGRELSDDACHVSPEDLDDANRSLRQCLDETDDPELQALLRAAIQNNQRSECPPVVLSARCRSGPSVEPMRARGPH
jgi:hypothetical protein